MSRPDECESCFNHVVPICDNCNMCAACSQKTFDEGGGYCFMCVEAATKGTRQRLAGSSPARRPEEKE